jgi:hypothetical protein
MRAIAEEFCATASFFTAIESANGHLPEFISIKKPSPVTKPAPAANRDDDEFWGEGSADLDVVVSRRTSRAQTRSYSGRTSPPRARRSGGASAPAIEPPKRRRGPERRTRRRPQQGGGRRRTRTRSSGEMTQYRRGRAEKSQKGRPAVKPRVGKSGDDIWGALARPKVLPRARAP